MDISAWLRGLGLERYGQAFRENAIDKASLPKLTAEDLRDLGVTAVGHRRILLDAIAALRAEIPRDTTERSVEPDRSGGKTLEAERRQLTVMFADLVGSTALSARLDPEDLRDVIGAYHRRCAEVITSSGGFVAKYLGDGVLAYFGYPQAHEEDAEQAVRAGLALIDAVAKLDAGQATSLQVRVGIASGLVVVGDLLGEGAAQEQAVIGETPNLAARLQGLAEPNTVVIADNTRRMLGGLFDYRDLGALPIAGIDHPVQVWRVLGASLVGSRFEALRTASTPLIGREEEIALLTRRWERAKAGDGSVVLIVGEPGIGKSRIAHTLLEQLDKEPHTRLRYFCSPHHQDTALYPTIAQLERAAGFQRDDTDAQRLDKLEAALAWATNDLGEVAPFLAELMSIPTNDRYPPLNLTPQKRKEKTLKALVTQVEGLSARQPVLMVVEDAHWIDPTSLELLDLTVERVPSLPVLLVITFRPEFTPPWVGRPQVTLLTLSRLSHRQRTEMLSRLTDGKMLPIEIAEQIIDRTDGVPLFIEELTKAVVESSELADEGDRDRVTKPMSPLAIPTTLHASLLARLDRLAPVREVAQIGAVLGRHFSHELISSVAPIPQTQLNDGLAQLVRAELIFRRGTPPHAEYTFKHSLVQDAAYGTLLRDSRQQLHARVVTALELQFPDIVAAQPELMAHHCAEARQMDRAIDHWLKAGERAARRSANLEALRHLTRGLEALRSLPESLPRDRRELAFQIAIGTPLIAVKGYSAPQTGAAFSRARALCERLGEVEPLAATLSGEFTYYFEPGNCEKMRRLVDEAQQICERLPNPVLRLASHRLAGITAMHSGAFSVARSEFEAITRLYDPKRHRSQPAHYVHDPEVSALTYLSLVLWILGFPDQARGSSAAALRCAADLDQANLTAHVRNFAGAALAELLGDVAAVRTHADAIVDLAERHSLVYWRVNGMFLRSWAMAHQENLETGLKSMRESAADRLARGVRWFQARYLCMLAAVHAKAGQADAGLGVISAAKGLLVQTNEHMWASELDRLEGELRRLQNAPVSDVESFFTRALTRSRQQNAKSLELRAASSLARLWRDQGKCNEARDLLAPIYGWFTEGFDTPDLKEAKALLQQLKE
jgi:predicted ATPase/class 3 adenylate cyclase